MGAEESIRSLTQGIVNDLLQYLGNWVEMRINLISPLYTLMPPTCMETLTFQDTQNLLHAIQALYALNNLNTFAVKALAIVDQLVPSEIPIFSTTNCLSLQISHTFLPGYPDFSPELEEIPRRYMGEHPIVQNMPRTLEGVNKISDFITQAEYHQLEGLYQQFMRVIGCEDQMVVFISNSNPQRWDGLVQANTLLVGITLHRSQRNFTERDRLILNLLRPHLVQAYCNAQHHHQWQQQFAQVHQSLNHLGLIILNDMGQIQFITPPATQWLQTYFGKWTHADQLPEHLWAWVRHQISGFTNNHIPSHACLPLRIEQAGKQLVIRWVINQVGEQYLLLLEEQTLSWLIPLELLGLSPREAEVLLWVIRGKNNKVIATHLNINISTVRKHLESTYHKLGVQSRTEAIAQALERLGVLNSPLLG